MAWIVPTGGMTPFAGTLDTRGGQMTTPMYREIADELRQQIESGEFEAGKQLPTEQDLQKLYNASRNTIRDAIKQLINLGDDESALTGPGLDEPEIDPF